MNHLNIESYIPGSIKMVFNSIGLDYNSFIECIVDNLSATFSLDFETTMNKKAIAAGIWTIPIINILGEALTYGQFIYKYLLYSNLIRI